MDLVYRVPRIARPGETLSSVSLSRFAGGKGANQSVALARAGACVRHAGRIGRDGLWLRDKIRKAGVDTRHIRVSDEPSGHAIIQVDDAGENAIVLFPGANRTIPRSDFQAALNAGRSGDIVLLQNEINDVPFVIRQARRRGLRVCLNPAPFDETIRSWPLDKVNILVLNETEGAGLSGASKPQSILDVLGKRLPRCEIVLTLGARGAVARSDARQIRASAVKVKAVDTTAAGDCFIGYYLAGRLKSVGIESCLKTACAAAALCVTRPGAMDSIPTAAEVARFLRAGPESRSAAKWEPKKEARS